MCVIGVAMKIYHVFSDISQLQHMETEQQVSKWELEGPHM